MHLHEGFLEEILGGGGSGAPPRISSVIPHQTSMQTTITVVICMIRSASSLLSCRPFVLRHQK